jgi:hypothetical protein
LRTNNVSETEFQAFMGTVETNLRQHTRSAKPRALPTAKVTSNLGRSSWRGRKAIRSRV